eukprot:1853105-Rhodomonas_salina.2
MSCGGPMGRGGPSSGGPLWSSGGPSRGGLMLCSFGGGMTCSGGAGGMPAEGNKGQDQLQAGTSGYYSNALAEFDGGSTGTSDKTFQFQSNAQTFQFQPNAFHDWSGYDQSWGWSNCMHPGAYYNAAPPTLTPMPTTAPTTQQQPTADPNSDQNFQIFGCNAQINTCILESEIADERIDGPLWDIVDQLTNKIPTLQQRSWCLSSEQPPDENATENPDIFTHQPHHTDAIDDAYSLALAILISIVMLWANGIAFTACMWFKIATKTLYSITTIVALLNPFRPKPVQEQIYKTTLRNGATLLSMSKPRSPRVMLNSVAVDAILNMFTRDSTRKSQHESRCTS